jgi:hypothetical protein
MKRFIVCGLIPLDKILDKIDDNNYIPDNVLVIFFILFTIKD